MKVVVLHSGGVDSSTLFAYKDEWDATTSLSFHYDQKHARQELRAAQRVADYYKIGHVTIQLTLPDFRSSLIEKRGGTIPKGEYGAVGILDTEVLYRNLIFAAYGASYAAAIGYDTIALGIHKSLYPDCSVAFATALQRTLQEGATRPVDLYVPFLNLTKRDIVEIGRSHFVPYQLTWSCYEGGDKPCGKCATCLERIEAFGGMPDE